MCRQIDFSFLNPLQEQLCTEPNVTLYSLLAEDPPLPSACDCRTVVESRIIKEVGPNSRIIKNDLD